MTEHILSADQAPSPKLDPETFVLRASPLRAIRFRRSVIVGLVTLLVLIVVGAAWFALKPRVFHLVADGDQQDEPAKPSTDALGHGPTSYSDVPKLGPPLPGDLGKPILERQRALDLGNGLAGGDAAVTQVAQAAQAERQRRAAELKAARESGVLVQTSGRTGSGVAEPVPAALAASKDPGASSRVGLDPDRDSNAQGRKADFVATRDNEGDANPHALTAPTSPYTLSAGSVIAASLITGLRSDLPGLVTAQVTQNVYDSATGRYLLVPQGARLIGTYDSVVAFGQKRALVVWQRIILPDGSSLRLDNVPATDASGYAGLADKVDYHTWSLLKGAALSTLLGVGAQLQFSGNSDLVEAIRQSTQQSVSRAGDQLTSRALAVQPSITIRPGTPVRLVVHKDLVLAPWRG